MKKILLFIALTSFITSHAMQLYYKHKEPDTGFEITIGPDCWTAHTKLGLMSQKTLCKPMDGKYKAAIVQYDLKEYNTLTSVRFDKQKQIFEGARYTITNVNCKETLTNCQTIENQTEIENLFNTYEKTFNETPQEAKHIDCSIQ